MIKKHRLLMRSAGGLVFWLGSSLVLLEPGSHLQAEGWRWPPPDASGVLLVSSLLAQSGEHQWLPGNTRSSCDWVPHSRVKGWLREVDALRSRPIPQHSVFSASQVTRLQCDMGNQRWTTRLTLATPGSSDCGARDYGVRDEEQVTTVVAPAERAMVRGAVKRYGKRGTVSDRRGWAVLECPHRVDRTGDTAWAWHLVDDWVPGSPCTTGSARKERTVTGQSGPCQLRHEQLTAPMGRTVLEAPLWPTGLRQFAGHGDLCVHIVLPRERARWNGLFAGVRVLAARTAHLGVHVPPERGGFSLDPVVLMASWGRRGRDRLTAVLADAAACGVDLTPQQVRVEPPPVTRTTLRLPAPTGNARAWGLMSVAWFPLIGSGISVAAPAAARAEADRSKEISDGLGSSWLVDLFNAPPGGNSTDTRPIDAAPPQEESP